MDNRVHLTIFRTVYQDRPLKLLSRQALASFEYGVTAGMPLAEGTFRLVRTQPPAETTLTRAGLRHGVRVRVIFESSATDIPVGFGSRIDLAVVRPDSAMFRQLWIPVAILAKRKEAPFAIQSELDGVLREEHVFGDRLQLSVIRTTFDQSTDKAIGFGDLISFGYDIQKSVGHEAPGDRNRTAATPSGARPRATMP
jgi:hypothetical protein